MILSLIVAMDRNRLIGSGDRLPWRIPEDLARFKKLTLGHPLIMGRRTHESIGRVLPGRLNIVLTGRMGPQPGLVRDCVYARSPQEALALVQGEEEVFVIGGEQVYRAFLPLADRLYVTLIQASFSGDTFFPEIDKRQWTESERQAGNPGGRLPFTYCFLTYVRKRAD